MESLPNEIMMIIASHLDIKSLTQWAQTSSRYTNILRDERMWKHRYRMDFPYEHDNIIMPTRSWHYRYLRTCHYKNLFQQEFSELCQIAEWVMTHCPQSWMSLYRRAQNNPLLIHPSIQRIYKITKSRCDYYNATLTFWSEQSNNSVKCYLINSGPSIGTSENVSAFILKLSSSSLRSKLESYFRDNNIAVRLTRGSSLIFDGKLITQPNGAQIWYPLVYQAGPGFIDQLNVNYT